MPAFLARKIAVFKGGPMKANRRLSSAIHVQSYFKLVLLVFLAAYVLKPYMAAAQGLTGTLIGTVRDEQGAVIPNGQVRVTSPALIGGAGSSPANAPGKFGFPICLPGSTHPTTRCLDLPSITDKTFGMASPALRD